MADGWVLGLETSGARGGVALCRDGDAGPAIALDEGLRHGTLLLPAIDDLLSGAGLRPADLAGVAVSAGPGSYTGVRIGVMAAKAIAYAAGVAVAPVSSLAALAWSLRERAGHVLAAQTARRDEVYAALYRNAPDGPVALADDRALAPEEAAALASAADGAPLFFAGTAAEAYPEVWRRLPAGVETAVPAAEEVARAVAWLGAQAFAAGGGVEPLALQPRYFRRDDGTGWRRDAAINGTPA